MNKNKGRYLYISLALILGALASFVLACDPDTPTPPTQYKVTFDTDKGSDAPAEQTVVSGAQATKPSDPTKDGFGFDGWYQVAGVGDAVGTTAYNFATETVTGNIILKAKWVVAHTVTFVAEDGSTISTAIVGDNAQANTIKRPTGLTKADSVLDGWVKVATANTPVVAGDTAYNFATETVTGSIILKAKWLPLPQLTMTKDRVGLREFTVATQGGDGASVVFIASRSDTPPAWSAIENNPARRTRTLNKPRSIYFSATDEYVAKSSGTFDLSQKGNKTEAEYLATELPGIMVPNTPYYVHVYYNGSSFKTLGPIQTKDYPTTLPTVGAAGTPAVDGPGGGPSLVPYLLALDDWKKPSSDPKADTELQPLELNFAELNFIPFRITRANLGPPANPVCSFGANNLGITVTDTTNGTTNGIGIGPDGVLLPIGSIGYYRMTGQFTRTASQLGNSLLDHDFLIRFTRKGSPSISLAYCGGPSPDNPAPVLNWPITYVAE